MKRFVLMALLLLACFAAAAQPAKIIVFRHAEKLGDDKNAGLSSRGQERAAALAPFLTGTPGLLGSGPLPVLFATRGSARREHNHTRATLEPLAARLGLQINTPFLNSETKALADFVLTDASCRGKTVVVCWTHTHLPALIQALGAAPAPKPWSKDVFDRIIVISFGPGRTNVIDLPQRLLFGDNPN